MKIRILTGALSAFWAVHLFFCEMFAERRGVISGVIVRIVV